MRKRFDIKFRPQIESGEYKVETRDGRPVKIISFEMTDTNDCPIAAQFRLCAGTPVVYLFDKEGHYKGEGDSDYDLFLVTPEPELTEFERVVRDALEYDPDLPTEEEIVIDVKEYASELLALAREEFIKDGYVIEKKTFHDAVEKVDAKVKDEVSANIDLENFIAELGKRYSEVSFAKLTRIAKAAYDFGKADALKDLPRWKKIKEEDNTCVREPHVGTNMVGEKMLYIGNRAISISRLEKLPGFKEE